MSAEYIIPCQGIQQSEQMPELSEGSFGDQLLATHHLLCWRRGCQCRGSEGTNGREVVGAKIARRMRAQGDRRSHGKQVICAIAADKTLPLGEHTLVSSYPARRPATSSPTTHARSL